MINFEPGPLVSSSNTKKQGLFITTTTKNILKSQFCHGLCKSWKKSRREKFQLKEILSFSFIPFQQKDNQFSYVTFILEFLQKSRWNQITFICSEWDDTMSYLRYTSLEIQNTATLWKAHRLLHYSAPHEIHCVANEVIGETNLMHFNYLM